MFKIGDRVEYTGNDPVSFFGGGLGVILDYRDQATDNRAMGYDVYFDNGATGWGIQEFDLQPTLKEPTKEEKVENHSFWDSIAE